MGMDIIARAMASSASLGLTNVKDFGAIGDGVSDDTLALQKALGKGKIVYLPSGNYVIRASGAGITYIDAAGLVGDGIEATKLIIEGRVTFKMKSGFRLENMTIETNLALTSVGNNDYLFENSGTILSPVIMNINYLNTNPVVDGSLRGRSFMKIICSDMHMENIKCSGSKAFLYVRNKDKPGDSDLLGHHVCENLSFRNITLENVEVGFYMSHGNVVDGFSDKDYLSKMSFEGIHFKNTVEQQGFYEVLPGRDLFMFEKVRDITITNVVCERAIERTAYFNTCHNIVVTNAISLYCEGWKFVANEGYMAKGFSASNIQFFGGNPTSVTNIINSCFVFYDARDILLDGINAVGEVSSIANQDINTLGYIINLSRKVENVKLTNVKAQNLLRCLALLDMRRHENAPDARLKNLVIDNVDVVNPISTYTDNNYSVVQPLWYSQETGPVEYVFEDIKLFGIRATQRYVNGAESNIQGHNPASRMKGLIRIDYVNGLQTAGNILEGFSYSNGWIHTGPNTKNVLINERMLIVDNIGNSGYAPVPSGLYLSAGSQYESKLHRSKHISGKQGTFVNKICVPAGDSDDGSVVWDVSKNAVCYLEGNAYLQENEDEFWLPYNIALKNAYANIVFSSGDHVQFVIDQTKTITFIQNSTNVSNTSVLGKICITSGVAAGISFLSVRNRTASPLHANVEYRYEIKG